MDICGQYKEEPASAEREQSRATVWKSLLTALCGPLRVIQRLRCDRARRRNFKAMFELDDRMLRDLGVTREELYRADSLPLSVNAACELRLMSLKRRRLENSGRLPR